MRPVYMHMLIPASMVCTSAAAPQPATAQDEPERESAAAPAAGRAKIMLLTAQIIV